MNLKKLEAYGFKSFADKLTLEFNDGVTCIVGPNGCGKSNVSDAIRWVLGEQSPKNLRGKKMEEVIFNGTTARKALGYCEVSLYFDNTERTYAWDADEVIIKRKLFRSGDSEYYRNNEQHRLRDILDLFRDTGIGKDGYSVVGQGKIDAFLSAKPEDRRQIFEEAAGISKYKAKRLESQRKLDHTADSLLRIKDKLDVYEERMVPLEKQSKEALRARELKEKLRSNEVNHFIYLTEHSAEEREAVNDRLNKVVKSLTDAEKERARLEFEYADTQETLRALDVDYKRLTDERLDLSIALSQKQGQNKLKVQELEGIRANLNRLRGEVAEKSTAITDHTNGREASKREQEQTILDLAAAKKAEEDIERQFAEVEQAVIRQRQEIDVTNDTLLQSADMLGELNVGLSKLRTEIVLLEKSVEENEDVVDEKQVELRETSKKLQDVTREIDAMVADRVEKKDFRKEIDEKYAERLASFEDGQDKYAELRDTVNNLTNRIQYLEASKNSYSSYGAAVRFIMNSNDSTVKDKVLGVVGNVITTPSQYATAIEVALGGDINNMITADQRDTSFLIDYLSKHRGGRGTFLPLTAMRPRSIDDAYMDALDEDGCYGIASDLVRYDRRFRPAIETLLGRVVVVDTKDTAIKMSQKYRNAFRIVTLDGAHYAVNGSVSGGVREGADSRLLSVEADLNEAKKNLSSRRKMLEVITAEMEEDRKLLKEMENTGRALDGVIAKLDRDISVAEQRRDFLTQENDRLTGEIDRLKKVIAENRQEISVKTKLCEVESAKTDRTSSTRVDANDLLTRLADELRARERERDAVNARRTEIMLRSKQLENKLTEIEKSIDISGRTINRLNAEILEAGSQIKVYGAQEASIAAELERLASELAENDELAEIQTKIDEMEGKKVSLTVKQEELRRVEQKNSELVASLSATKAKAEAALDRIESEMRAAGERVWEEYGLDYDGAKELKLEDYNDDDGVKAAKELRRELAKMGDINEKAVEDLATMSAEYKELKLHYDDIVEAKTSLEETIKDLTSKMEINFSESFEKIKVNFAEVFTELFHGGVGKLDLDMEQGMSVLDAGIVIEAQPPGKRLQNIDLLSGGERAMTAIAIIFAIIKLHPMPFCVLDEVDAPLDDANADTYATYLKKFSTDTQFIIISHRKPTMELADVLYGITMQEKGVSKFFKVKLNDALKMAK